MRISAYVVVKRVSHLRVLERLLIGRTDLRVHLDNIAVPLISLVVLAGEVGCGDNLDEFVLSDIVALEATGHRFDQPGNMSNPDHNALLRVVNVSRVVDLTIDDAIVGEPLDGVVPSSFHDLHDALGAGFTCACRAAAVLDMHDREDEVIDIFLGQVERQRSLIECRMLDNLGLNVFLDIRSS